MKKRLICILLTFMMVFGLMSTAVAAAEADIYVGGVGMSDGDYLAVGATATTKTKPSGGYVHYNNNVLTMNNYSYSGSGYDDDGDYCGIYCDDYGALNIVLQGNNSIHVSKAGKTCYGILYRYAVNISGASGSKLTLSTDSNYGSGIYTYNASNSDISISGVTFEVKSFNTGIYATSDNAVITFENSTVKLLTLNYAINSRNDVIIENSEVDCIASNGSYGIYCDGDVTITDSTVNTAGLLCGINTRKNVSVADSNFSARSTTLQSSRDHDGWAISYGSGCHFEVGSGLTTLASTEPEGTLSAYDAAKHSTYDLIVVKDPSAPAYKVTFNSNGGSSVASQNVKYYEKATKPANPTRSGYTFKWWELDGEIFDFNTPIRGNSTLKAVWRDNSVAVPKYTVTFNANGGSGTMASVTMDEGDYYTLPKCGFTAPAGKIFRAWDVDGVEKAVGEKILMTANTTLKAVWVTGYTVTFDANGGKGTMAAVQAPSGYYHLPYCQFTPPNGKVFVGWMIDDTMYKPGASIWLGGNKTLQAQWSYEITEAHALLYTPVIGNTPDMTPSTYAGANYTVSLSHWFELVSGYPDLSATDTFKDSYYHVRIYFTPKDGYTFSTKTKFYINGKEAFQVGGSGSTLLYESGVDVIEKSSLTSINEIRIDGFEEPHAGGSCNTDITLSNNLIANEIYWWRDSNGDGMADESNCERFKEGGDYYLRIELMPKAGYTLPVVWEPGRHGGTYYYTGDIYLNGEKLTERVSCFSDGSGMVLQFWEQPAGPYVNPFTDVKESDYFYEPVKWAVLNGVTTGMTPTTFGPEVGCTRAHAVTFLWRASGNPEPTGNTMPFTDVEKGSYYEKAVMWAVENGITAGTSATTFSPDANCERSQIVTFLWRLAGEPAPSSMTMPFTDVEKGGYYEKAVLWAVEEGITNGMTPTTFGPTQQCTRGQIVTFLWRYIEN